MCVSSICSVCSYLEDNMIHVNSTANLHNCFDRYDNMCPLIPSWRSTDTSNLQTMQVDSFHVLLIGGSSQLPAVEKMLLDTVPNSTIETSLIGYDVLALGATLQAAVVLTTGPLPRRIYRLMSEFYPEVSLGIEIPGERMSRSLRWLGDVPITSHGIITALPRISRDVQLKVRWSEHCTIRRKPYLIERGRRKHVIKSSTSIFHVHG